MHGVLLFQALCIHGKMNKNANFQSTMQTVQDAYLDTYTFLGLGKQFMNGIELTPKHDVCVYLCLCVRLYACMC